MKVFVAGATGVLGRQLVPQLVARGHEVVGMTRSACKQDLLRSLGARPVVADALDPDAVAQAVAFAEPEVIVHQLTALSGPMSMREARHLERSAAFTMTNRLRTEGTDHLLDDEPAPVREWLPVLASALDAKPPRHVPRWLARLAAGEVATVMMTDVRGACNEKAKREPVARAARRVPAARGLRRALRPDRRDRRRERAERPSAPTRARRQPGQAAPPGSGRRPARAAARARSRVGR
ncbi:MAG TPA: NAD(P)H-binding protein [Solirubrobacteraceae bacterium]|jgi:NAD(P)-dependent dehydrogenase (short-subunit alcohol dehydrogenase family)|nr:NAD(P)H-binding protein [Solirubrobacteraceae bacterium]